MTQPTLPTIKCVELIHKAEALKRLTTLDATTLDELTRLTDAVLSFTSFYLRHAEPACRPEQLSAYLRLKLVVESLENSHGQRIEHASGW